MRKAGRRRLAARQRQKILQGSHWRSEIPRTTRKQWMQWLLLVLALLVAAVAIAWPGWRAGSRRLGESEPGIARHRAPVPSLYPAGLEDPNVAVHDGRYAVPDSRATR
jgi:hypothetical protein